MNCQKLLQQVIGATLVIVFLVGCTEPPTRHCPPKHSFISLNPDSFEIPPRFPNEYLLDLNLEYPEGIPLNGENTPIPNNTKCFNLSGYVLEMTFQERDDRPAKARLYFKNVDYEMNISFLQDITSGEPICFDPKYDKKSFKDQLENDFTCIWGVGAEIPGGAENVEVISATLIRRENNP